jgi:hypothetical protein
MRASDLIGLPVRGPGGHEHGQVLDIRLVQDGPLRGAYAAMRIESLVVGHHTLAAHLGYDRAGTTGPWLVDKLVDLITRHNRLLPWPDARLEDGVVTTDRTDLEPVDEI